MRSQLRSSPSEAADSSKLLLTLPGAQVIPQCMTTQKKEQRNRGAYDDIWDDGPVLGRTASGKPIEISVVLLAVVGLLSLEWLGRKLLRLA